MHRSVWESLEGTWRFLGGSLGIPRGSLDGLRKSWEGSEGVTGGPRSPNAPVLTQVDTFFHHPGYSQNVPGGSLEGSQAFVTQAGCHEILADELDSLTPSKNQRRIPPATATSNNRLIRRFAFRLDAP